VTTSATDPATAPTPDAAEPAPAAARPGPSGLFQATAIIATIGVVVALIGLGLLFLPVQTPTQDCGTSIGFLLDGRVNELVSETAPPAGITPAEAKANNAQPCRSRVADRTKPAAVLFVAGMVAALGAATTEVAVRATRWFRRRPPHPKRSAAKAPAAPGSSGPPAQGTEPSGSEQAGS